MWPMSYAESLVDLGWESQLRALGSPPASGVLEPQGAAGEWGADEPSGLEPFGLRGQWADTSLLEMLGGWGLGVACGYDGSSVGWGASARAKETLPARLPTGWGLQLGA